MPKYVYKARDREGQRVAGSIEAEGESDLIAKLHQKKLMVLSLTQQRTKPEVRLDLRRLLSAGIPRAWGRIKLATLLSFTTQLSAMVGAGLPLVQSLRALSFDTEDMRFRKVIHDLAAQVSEGNSLSKAMEKFPHIFNKIFVSMIKAGENSGKLGEILSQLTSYLDSNFSLRRKVQSALTYPIVVVVFAILVILFMVVKIIPKFEKIYAGFGKELPLPTRILLGISSQIQHHFFSWFLVAVCVAGLTFFFGQSAKGRLLFDRIKLRLPLFGQLNKKSLLSNFSRTLSVLVSSGIPLVPAMRLAIETIDNRVISQNLSDITTDIEEGAGIGESFRKSGFFPEIMVQMVSTGEKTGAIDEMVLRTADFYEKQVDSSINTLTTLLEPIVIALIGLVVGGMMLAMFLPVFKLGGIMHR